MKPTGSSVNVWKDIFKRKEVEHKNKVRMFVSVAETFALSLYGEEIRPLLC